MGTPVRATGFTLIEIIAGIALLTFGLLLCVAGVIQMTNIQRDAYYRTLAATFAMAIGEYRIRDMEHLAPGVKNATDKDFAWRSASSTAPWFKAAECGLFLHPSASKQAFTPATGYTKYVPGTSGYGTKYPGELLSIATTAPAMVALNGDTGAYQDILVSFSRPTSGSSQKIGYAVMDMWLGDRKGLSTSTIPNYAWQYGWTSANQTPPLKFLGRFLIVDSVWP